MVLESLEPKENDKILGNFFFKILGGFEPPPKPPFLGFWGVLGEPETPQNCEKKKFLKILGGLELPQNPPKT